MPAVYLASPYGFSPATEAYLAELKRALTSAGHTVNDPWELGHEILSRMKAKSMTQPEEERINALREFNHLLGKTNQEALDRSDVVVAALDGPDVDSGTASEIGYAFARGKRIIGLRGDFRRSGENDAAVVNLQVQYWIDRSGGRIVRSIQQAIEILKDREGRRA